MRLFRVGLAQINPTVGDFEANVRMVVDGIARDPEGDVLFDELVLLIVGVGELG